MNGFTYQIELIEPVLATGLEGEPNSSVSLPYVPGGLIRGAVVFAYLKKAGRDELDATSEDDRRLFLDGRTRFLNAFPLVELNGIGYRSLPISLSWRVRKGDSSKVYDLSSYFDEIDQPKVVTGLTLEQGDLIYAFTPPFQVNVHTQRDAERGRATSSAGAVYRYQALPAGLRMGGIVLTENETDAKTLRVLLENHEFLLGGARTAGYGRTRFLDFQPIEVPWSELGEDRLLEESMNYDRILVRCLSDVLLRDALGNYSLDLPAAIAVRLGVNVSVEVQHQRPLAFCNAKNLGGFNRKWGLPLVQATGLQAGSTFLLRFDSSCSGDRLLQLQESGIGERRAEGFGRLAFLDPECLNPQFQSVSNFEYIVPAPTVVPTNSSLSTEETRLAQIILQRLLSQDIEKLLMEKINNAHVNNPPSKSQLSRWRVLLQNVLASFQTETDQQHIEWKRLQDFLLREQDRNTRSWQAFERAYLEWGASRRSRLAKWMQDLLEDPRTVWDYLEQPKMRHLGDDLETQISTVQTYETCIRLIYGVMDKAARSRTEEVH